MKKEIERLQYIRGAMFQLMEGIEGKPFRWGEHEGESKMAYLSRLGFVLVSKSKLEKGGHELKRNAKPVGSKYYGSPLKLYADLYLLGIQTKRTLKWHDLWHKGKALLEDGTYTGIVAKSREEKIAEARERISAAQIYIQRLEGEGKNEQSNP